MKKILVALDGSEAAQAAAAWAADLAWSIGEAKLEDVANREKKMPRNYISRDGFGITAAGRDYLAPLIAGEAYPQYRKGMPVYVQLKNTPGPRKLKRRFKVSR